MVAEADLARLIQHPKLYLSFHLARVNHACLRRKCLSRARLQDSEKKMFEIVVPTGLACAFMGLCVWLTREPLVATKHSSLRTW